MTRILSIFRETPWGPMGIADAHVHFFSRRFFETLASQKAGLTIEEIGERLGASLPPLQPEELAAGWLREMDRDGVAKAALMASVPGDEVSVEAAVRAHPHRFFAMAMVNPRVFDAAKFASIHVACLFPAMHAYSLSEEFVRPVFEWAEQNRRTVFVHCGVLSVGVRAKLGLSSPFDMRFSNPLDLHSIALRYPAVPIVVPHFGAGLFREALMLADLCPNVYLDTSSTNSWTRYLETRMHLRDVFRRAVDVVGPRRLLFGTDSSLGGWRRQIFDDQARALYEIDLSEADARAVFGENLLRILGR